MEMRPQGQKKSIYRHTKRWRDRRFRCTETHQNLFFYSLPFSSLLFSFVLFPTHLFSSHLFPATIVSSLLLTSHFFFSLLFSSLLISFFLISFLLLSFYLFSSPLFSSSLFPSRLSHIMSSPLLSILPGQRPTFKMMMRIGFRVRVEVKVRSGGIEPPTAYTSCATQWGPPFFLMLRQYKIQGKPKRHARLSPNF
jgi:hypothetical protein